MRKISAAQKQPFPLPDVVTKPVPAPTDGLDAISPLADMDLKRAPILTNWVPRPGWVEVRAGYAAYVQGLSNGPVETLMVLRSQTGQKLIAATGLALWDVSQPGIAGAVKIGQNFNNNRWQYTNFATQGGNTILQMVNGADPLQQYDGTTLGQQTVTQPSGWPLASFSTSNFINIFSTKQRLWYVYKNSTIVVFGAVGAITGQAAGFQDLGTLFDRGGFLVAMADWTIDGGEGPSSYTAFISSEGQIALYQGIDPTNTSLWSLVGVFSAAPPIGFRCAERFGSDVVLITYQGLIPLSQSLPFDPSADRSAALTARIQNLMNLDVQSAKGNFGWQFISFPVQTLAFLNVPLVENNSQTQEVQNTLTGAWTTFTGWNANCFALYNQQLYFGDNTGNVNLAYQGGGDLVSAIAVDMQTAFNWFDDPGREKRMTMIQPLMTSNGQVTPSISVDVDFSSVAPSFSATPVSASATWDHAIWDQSTWPPGVVQITNVLGVTTNPGRAMAVRMSMNVLASGPGSTSVFDMGTFDNAVFDGLAGQTVTLQVNAFNAILELGGFL